MHRNRLLAAAAAAGLALAGAARAEVKTEAVEYKQGDTELQGFFAWDDAVKGKRPGVLVIHEWWGHNEHARNQAIRLAKAGYVGFALDMFGKGKLAKHPEDAQAFVKEATEDPMVTRVRFDAALARLKAHPQVNPEDIGAVGYCFGGGVALGMARMGEDLDVVATFHGALAHRGPPAAKGKVKARIFVATGGADPMVTKDQVDAFEKEMKDAGVRVEVVVYPNVKHSFTNPDAGKAGMSGLAYDAEADQKSWEAAMKVFHEVWKGGSKS